MQKNAQYISALREIKQMLYRYFERRNLFLHGACNKVAVNELLKEQEYHQ